MSAYGIISWAVVFDGQRLFNEVCPLGASVTIPAAQTQKLESLRNHRSHTHEPNTKTTVSASQNLLWGLKTLTTTALIKLELE